MTVQEETQQIIEEVRAWKWTPELFERVRNALGYADIFHILRRELTSEEYQQFDLEYCSHYRPQDRELTKWLEEERKVREWKEKKRALLKQKKKLLSGK